MSKVLMLITKAELGGAQTSVYSLAKELKARGYEISVGYGEPGPLVDNLTQTGIHTHRFPTLRRTHHPLRIFAFVRELTAYLRQHPIDVLYMNSSNTLFGVLAARRVDKRIRTVFTFRGLSYLDPNYKKNPLVKGLHWCIFKWLAAKLDAQVFVSKHNQALARRLKLATNDRVIYNGLDLAALDFVDRDEARRFLSQKTGLALSNRFIIGSIGRLAYQKNYEFLIKQAKQIQAIRNDVAIVIIGSGPEADRYRALIDSEGVKDIVFLAGAVPDAARYLRGFDLFALVSRYEGLSVTMIEALYAGLPILASDAGGNTEIVGDAGKIYPLDNAQAFLEYLQPLLTNENERNMLVKRAAERPLLFSIKRTADGYGEVFG